ncbi:type I-D CRISPR-associated protein Cas5/Csc1 [Nodosilinea sp. P-1105]|uniref:type I-D CRISPR-associated protein Cas5/Csc1 n=1 Tax=Nodosilinea sp. P-1105 TaxID=2546229 RepID=UPI00146DBC87|nr:type I-D CRISPR-associated protein Cas5/Csc1 [Nodosilinea sp. P-1105]NMF81792.1 type I-D CRISPR-associated protein Cas5/Csc1 [Nodosilinea sp. P-1105]
MTQVELEPQTTPLPYPTAQLIELWCAEPVFFASRELSDTYYTEGTIGNYALAYALGWARSPYRLLGAATGRPTYLEDLTPLTGQRYILPAWPLDTSASFRFERFNALSDSYWYAMTNNRVAIAREDLPLKRTGKKPSTFRPSNFPQTGRLRVIERGNRFQTIVFGNGDLPEYIRVGKFMSKVRVEIVKTFSVTALSPGEYNCHAYLNSADLPSGLSLLSFDLISIPPASLLKNLRFSGAAWQVGDYTLPANLEFCGGRNHG